MKGIEFIKQIFFENGGVVKTKILRENGLSSRDLKQFVDAGIIEQIRWGYYQFADNNDFSEIPILVSLFPDGILCMESALDHYGYIERTPDAWEIAVDAGSGRKRFQIPYPIIHPHFIINSKLNIGVTTAVIDETEIKIYDRERTICDCLYHRNKMDAEVFNQAVQSYLKDENRREYILANYASKLHVTRKVRDVLGIWL